MKKIDILLLITLLSTVWLGAQVPSDDIAQPKNVVGRRINAAGVITKEYNASFSYDETSGKLNSFHIPNYELSSRYRYEDDFLTSIFTYHDFYDEVLRYTYEDGRVKLEAHEWDEMNSNEYFEYTYYDNGRLASKTYAANHPEDVYGYSTFEYENHGKTSRESYSAQVFQGYTLVQLLQYRITCQYDENHKLLSKQTEKYNDNGEVTKNTRILYSYSPNGSLENEVSQTLINNNWENTAIHKYIYDGEERLTEQQEGTWSTELGDWNITKKITHEYSADNTTYTVSFYKKTGNEWVWDIFDNQKLFFMPELKLQQAALSYFAYEDLLGSAQLNQMEFQMIYTKTPAYATEDKKDDAVCLVRPNPTNGEITITGKDLKSATVYNALGQRVDTAETQGDQLMVNLSDYPAGVYFVNVTDQNGKRCVKKVVKE